MKKVLALLTTTVILTAAFLSPSNSVHAQTNNESYMKIISETTEYFKDGSYVTIFLAEESSALTRTSIY